MALVRKKVISANCNTYRVEDSHQAFGSHEHSSTYTNTNTGALSSSCSYGLKSGTCATAPHVREMTGALLRRELAFRAFSEQGLPTDEGRINAYAWAQEGSFKDRSAGIMSMFNVLNALMLVIVLQVLINPPLFQGRSWNPNDSDHLTADTLVRLWTLFCIIASCGLIYTVYITAFMYVSYVCCGSDLEAIIFHARMRAFYFSATACTFLSYLSLVVSLFISTIIFFGATYAWFVFTTTLSLLTIIVIVYSRLSAALTYKNLVSLETCYERTTTGGVSRVLKPFWANQLHLLEFGTPAPAPASALPVNSGESAPITEQSRANSEHVRETAMPLVNTLFQGGSE